MPELGKEYGGNALGTENMETGEIVLFDNLKFEVPDQYIKDYYLAFYAYQPNYAKGFDEAKLPKVSYVFDSKGGSAIDGVSAVMVEKMPVPEKEGVYFHGWYSVDGTASGEWGDMVAFPYLFDGGESVTLYARWEKHPQTGRHHGYLGLRACRGANRFRHYGSFRLGSMVYLYCRRRLRDGTGRI